MLTKVFVAGAAGSLLASWSTPYIVPKLPESLRTGNMAKATHAVIAGASAMTAYWALGKLGIAG